MPTKLQLDTSDASLATSEINAKTFSVAVPTLADVADIGEAFEWLWRGADGIVELGGNVPGVAAYLDNFNTRLLNIESASRIDAGLTPPSTATLLPKDNSFFIVNNSNLAVKTRFEVQESTTGTHIYRLPSLATVGQTAELVTKDATQALTNKTFTGIVVTGGSIDNTAIGTTTASTGRFTTITSTSTTDATTKDTGGIVIEGGIGVEKNVYAGGNVYGAQLIATGAGAPLSVGSNTTLVTNLNADRLDGEHGTYYLAWSNFSGIPANVSSINQALTTTSNVNFNQVTTGTFITTNFQINGTTEYGAADIVTNRALNTASPLVDTALISKYPALDYVVSVSNGSGTSIYKMAVVSTGTSTCDYNVYSEVSNTGAPTLTFDATASSGTTTVTFTPSATATIAFFRVSTKVT